MLARFGLPRAARPRFWLRRFGLPGFRLTGLGLTWQDRHDGNGGGVEPRS
jgi:hypothetical protein